MLPCARFLDIGSGQCVRSFYTAAETRLMPSTSLDKRKIKFLLLEAVHESAVETLRKEGYENIETLKTSLSEDDLVEKIKDVHFVGLRSRTQLTERVFAAAKKAASGRLLLHRHKSGRSQCGAGARYSGVQRTVFQYAQCGRTGHRSVYSLVTPSY